MSVQPWIPIPSVFTTPYHPQVKKEPNICEMAPLCRFEPEGSEWLIKEPEAACFVDKIGWGKFFDNFNGHNVEITRIFSLSFNGEITQIGDLQLTLFEDFIAEATKLPPVGDRWFKKGMMNRDEWKMFILSLPKYFNEQFGFSIRFFFETLVVTLVSFDSSVHNL